MNELLMVPIGRLDRSHNVRAGLGDLAELVESVGERGIVVPVTVARANGAAAGEGREWILVAGHRRVAAAEEVGLDTVPALVKEYESDADRLLDTLAENLQRLDLNPLDEARGYRRLVDAGWSQAEVSRRVGRSKGHVTRRLTLLQLPEAAQQLVADGTTPLAHGYDLARLAALGASDTKLERLARAAPYQTHDAIKSATAAAARRQVAAELRAQGVQVENVDSLWNSKHAKVDYMGIDSEAHAAEPCHVAIVHSGYSDQGHVAAGCKDAGRHTPTGSDNGAGISGLQMPDREARQREENRRRDVERDEQRRRRKEEYQQLGRDLGLLEDAVAIEAALRIAALDILAAPDEDDALLPYPDGYTPHAGRPQEGLAEAVAIAEPATLARALLRGYVDMYVRHQSWQAKQHPHVTKAAREVSKLVNRAKRATATVQ